MFQEVLLKRGPSYYFGAYLQKFFGDAAFTISATGGALLDNQLYLLVQMNLLQLFQGNQVTILAGGTKNKLPKVN